MNKQTNQFGPFTFRDIEHALNAFSGKDSYRIETWMNEFEDYARMFSWNDMQKLFYAKRLMKDTAKLFLRTTKTQTYDELKQALLKEFGRKESSAEIHKWLQTKKKKSDENLHDYTLRMIEIGNSNGVDEQSVIQYIIDGIDDERCNKVLLYGAKTYDELKFKMLDYAKYKETNTKKKDESVKNQSNTKPKPSEKSDAKKKPEQNGNRCYLCGDSSHMMGSCPTKEKGVKCFKCSSYGHKAAECGKENADNKKEDKSLMCLNGKSRAVKLIKVNGKEFYSLIDTGSDINAMRRSAFEKLKTSEVQCDEQNYKGAGGANVTVSSNFFCLVTIDGEEFSTVAYVVKDTDIPNDIVIGNELLFNTILTMNRCKITVRKVENETENEADEEKQLMCMAITDSENDVPIAIKELCTKKTKKRKCR